MSYLLPRYQHFQNKKYVQLSNQIIIEYCIHSIQSTISFFPFRKKKIKRIVLIMGYASTQEQWDGIIKQLLRKWSHYSMDALEILTFNNRGVGKSSSNLKPYGTYEMAEDLYLLIQYLNWKRVHIVGTSMGGMIAMEFVYHYPEYVSSLTLITTTRGRFRPDIHAQSPVWNLCTTINPLISTHYLILSMFPLSYLQSKLPDGRFVYDSIYHKCLHIKLMFPSSISSLIGHFVAIATHYISDDRLHVIKNYKIPILIIGAEDDIVIPVQETFKLRNILNSPHVRTIIYKKSGHGIIFQHTKDIAMEIIKTILLDF